MSKKTILAILFSTSVGFGAGYFGSENDKIKNGLKAAAGAGFVIGVPLLGHEHKHKQDEKTLKL